MVDVSRNVVAILLVLVIVVSGFGTYSMLSNKEPVVVRHASQQGEIGLAIQPPNQAQIGLTIEANNNG